MNKGHDAGAERQVLAALMKNPASLASLMPVLSPIDFYDKSNQRIHEVISELHSAGDPISPTAVLDRLDARESSARMQVHELESSGGSGRKIASALAAASVVSRHASRRETYAVGKTLIEQAPGTGTIELVIEEAIGVLAKAKRAQGRKTAPLSPEEVKAKTLAEFEDQLSGEGPQGVTSGIATLDKLTNTWRTGNFIILAARPAMGKSALALQIARYVSQTQGDVIFFSQEMTTQELQERLIANDTGIDSKRIRNAKALSESERDRVRKSLKGSKDRIHIGDATVSIAELENHIVALKSEHPKVKLVIIDYLQIMGSTRRKGDNQTNEISERSQRIKSVAKRADVVIIALSQLSRAVEQRGGDKRPMLSDLRDSGSLEQDADSVIFLYRPDYYDITEDADGNSLKGLASAIVAKNRHGSIGDAEMKYYPATNKFIAYDRDTESAEAMQAFAKTPNPERNPWEPDPTLLQSQVDVSDKEIEF